MKGLDSNQISDKSKEAVYAITYTSWNSEIVGTLLEEVSGLIAADEYPSPIPFADVVTTTTHKTLRGPRGGLILAKEDEEIHKKLNSGIFPGTQGGPLMHIIAAKAVAFQEALKPNFKDYIKSVLANAKILSETLKLFEKAPNSLLFSLANAIREKFNGNNTFFNKNVHIEPTNICVFDNINIF